MPATVGVAEIVLTVRKSKLPTSRVTEVELVKAFTTVVAVEVSVVDPPTFVAVTATLINLLTSALAKTYEEDVAPDMAE